MRTSWEFGGVRAFVSSTTRAGRGPGGSWHGAAVEMGVLACPCAVSAGESRRVRRRAAVGRMRAFHCAACGRGAVRGKVREAGRTVVTPGEHVTARPSDTQIFRKASTA